MQDTCYSNYPSDFAIAVKECPAPRVRYTALGYLNNQPTDTTVLYRHGGKRRYRVYVTQTSNCAIYYINVKGKRVYLTDSDLFYATKIRAMNW